MELDALNEIVDDLHQLSATLVAITPQVPEQNQRLVEQRNLDFDVLFDDDNQFAHQLDLVHGFPENLKNVYGKFGIDLDAANGNSKWELAIPSRFVVDKTGTIQSAELNADYTIRPEPAATLELVRRLANSD